MMQAMHDAREAIKALLSHYGPPADVAHICVYPEDHPISLARKAIARLDASANQLPVYIPDSHIANVIAVAESVSIHHVAGRDRRALSEIDPVMRRFYCLRASALLRAVGTCVPDPGDDALVEKAAAAVWKSTLGENRSGENWPQDVIGGSQELFREIARAGIARIGVLRSAAVNS